MTSPAQFHLELALPTAEATRKLAEAIAPGLRSGDVLLLAGPIGAGKSHFARSLIRWRMARVDAMEDVPSPTFTLVQSYALPDGEIWHADLYRLSSPEEAVELGLSEAFDDAICLVEWPDRLSAPPAAALHLDFLPLPGEETRKLALHGPQAWADRLTPLLEEAS